MTILVDAAVWRRADRPDLRFAHLASDHSYDELHAFASVLGIERRRFQGDHYDVTADLRRRAIENGAEPVAARDIVARLKRAGLRRAR